MPLRVLVVDDLDLVRRALVRQLARAGHAVVGEAATAAAGVAAAAALTPDVVLLDQHLPDGLGTDVAARILADAARAAGDAPFTGSARVPAVVLCTGDVAAAHAAGAARCGAHAVLEKPADATALDAAVRAAAHAREALDLDT